MISASNRLAVPPSLVSQRDAEVVDVEFRRLVRMPVNDGPDLPDDQIVDRGNAHDVVWCVHILGKTFAVDPVIEYIIGHAAEHAHIGPVCSLDHDLRHGDHQCHRAQTGTPRDSCSQHNCVNIRMRRDAAS